MSEEKNPKENTLDESKNSDNVNSKKMMCQMKKILITKLKKGNKAKQQNT